MSAMGRWRTYPLTALAEHYYKDHGGHCENDAEPNPVVTPARLHDLVLLIAFGSLWLAHHCCPQRVESRPLLRYLQTL